MSLFCFQCGVLHHPEPAIGVDEDGEPACAMHRDKSVVTKEAEAPKRKESTEMAKRLCKCGCGQELNPATPWNYVRGHKPKGVLARVVGEDLGRGAEVGHQEAEPTADVALTSTQIDLIFASMPIAVKARMLASLK